MAEKKVIHVQIYRSPSPDREDGAREGEYKECGIPYVDRMTVLNVLDYIHENHERSLTYYKSCRIRKCTGCLVEVNGKNKLACTTLAKSSMKIGPAKGRKVIRDLVVEDFPR